MAESSLEFPPKRRMIFDKYNGKEGEKKCLKSILEHHFSFSVGVLMPFFSRQQLYESILKESLFSEYCCLAEISLAELINMEFILKFVKPGVLCGLSYGTKVDTSNCAALLSTGILHLSLTKDTYECIGITGRPSPFKNNQRFDVEVNLLAQYFKPSKKCYERVLKGFLKTALKFKFLFSLLSSTDVDQASQQKLQTYFKAHGIVYSTFSCIQEIQEFSELNFPVISFDSEGFTEMHTGCNGLFFHEWLGCVFCGIDCSDAAADSFVNTLSCPEPCHCGNMVLCKWTGFFSSQAVCRLLKLGRDMLDKNLQVPWLSIIIWGFNDSPLSWSDRRHGYFTSGDNHSTVVMFQNEQLWLFRALGNHDE